MRVSSGYRVFRIVAIALLLFIMLMPLAWMVLSSFFGLSTFAGGKVNYTGMLVFCAIFGFGGAFVSCWSASLHATAFFTFGMRAGSKPLTITRERCVDFGAPSSTTFDRCTSVIITLARQSFST